MTYFIITGTTIIKFNNEKYAKKFIQNECLGELLFIAAKPIYTGDIEKYDIIKRSKINT